MPAVEAWVIVPLWVQFAALLPERHDDHPLGCHKPCIPDRVVFDKIVAKMVFAGSYRKHADATCSATTMRACRDEWIAAGVFQRPEQIVLDAYDTMVGLQLGDVSVDGQITRAPAGGQAAGKSPWTAGSWASSGLG